MNLKPKVAILKQSISDADLTMLQATITTNPPNNNMQQFNGQFNLGDKKSFFKLDNVLLRGVRLENTAFVYLAVIFAGLETRLMQTKVKTKVKSSRMSQRINKLAFYQAVLSIVLMITLPLVSYGCSDNFYLTYASFHNQPSSKAIAFLYAFITYFILLAYLLPISLFVSLELTRLFNAMQVENDKKMRRKDLLEW